MRWSYICDIDFWAKMASLQEAFSGKRFVCCALTIVYSIHSTVGQSIATMYDIGYIYWIWTSVPYYMYYVSIYVCLYDYVDY